MSSKRNAVLIGCGSHAQNILAPLMHGMKDIGRIVYVDPVIERARALLRPGDCALGEIPHSRLDETYVAFVATPPNPNVEIVGVLSKWGIPIYIEKPVGLNSQHIRAISDAHSRGSSLLYVGYNFRYSRFAERLRGIHRLGEWAHSLEVRYLSRHPSGPEWNNPDGVASWLLHNGVHAIDLLLTSFGPDAEVINFGIESFGDRFLMFARIDWPRGPSVELTLGNHTERFDFSFTCRNSNADSPRTESIWTNYPGNEDEPAELKLVRFGYQSAIEQFLQTVRLGRNGQTEHQSLPSALAATRLAERILAMR